MAIRIECYELIVPTKIGELYFPEQYTDKWCWNDGSICRPMGAMNPLDAYSIVQECENLGLSRFKEDNGVKVIGDFYVASQFGFDDTLKYGKQNWLRVYQDVAWNPSCPLGTNLPDKFPCYHGGFYYESQEVWDEAGLVLGAFNKALDEYESKLMTHKDETDESDGLIKFDFNLISIRTSYDNFFIDLGRKTFEQEMIDYSKKVSE